MSWLKSLLSLKPNIEARGGAVLLMTSESPDWTQTVRDTTAYKDTIIIDPENKLAAELKKRGLIDLAISSKSGYPHGMSQPGILVVRKDESVLYSWAINPSLASIFLFLLSINRFVPIFIA